MGSSARTSVGDVEELGRAEELDEVLENGGLQEFTVEFGDTIDLSATDASKVSHADVLWVAFLDERHSG